MNFENLFTFFLLFYIVEVTSGLICKCTQSSLKTPCTNGICETDSETSACLMLDHPTSGRHYACTTSQIKEGECIDKTSKSGATVKVCSCHTSDYCNFKRWPTPDNINSFTSEEMTTNPRRQVHLSKDQLSVSSHHFSSSFFYMFYSFISLLAYCLAIKISI